MYDELVKALRRCSYMTVAGADREDGYCKPCAYFAEDTSDITCIDRMILDAADAIEKMIAEIDHKDKVIQGLLTQIERFSSETSTLQNRIEHQNATIDSLYKTIEKLTEQKEKGNE